MKRLNPRLVIGLMTAWPALVITPAIAQATPAPPPAPSTAPVVSIAPYATHEELLGASFQSPLDGIAFRVPGSCQQVPKAGDEIARFANPEKTWEMTVSRSTSSQPMALTGEASKMGLLEVVAARLKQASPSIEIVRQDTINLGENQAGILAARISVGAQKKLLQEAIVQANDQLYYSFTLTTPASKDAAANAADPIEQLAVESFRQMLDTVKLLDRSAIKDEQNERLFRTRAFFVTLDNQGKKLTGTLVPEQWLRLMKDGKDIGYTYIVEEPGTQGPNEGIKIGIRSRSYPERTVQVDGETWYFVSFDRKHETWRNLAWVQNLETQKSDQFTEVGTSDRRVQRALDKTGQFKPGDAKDEKQPPTVAVDTYAMEVQALGNARNVAPVKQDLPPWYLPQAVGHLLPRLLPLREPKTYLFAVYVSDQSHVMHRYVDVGVEQEVDLAGQRVRAVPISDRIGLKGTPTVHYLSPDGKYLGSVNKESKITILPTDPSTLQKIWENRADLTRPRDIQPPAK